jgi:uncharacterized phage protein (TIGR01671 family)
MSSSPMSQPIKFRVWNKDFQLFTFDYLVHQNGTIFSWQVGNTVCKTGDGVIFQQFTGLLDKNGKEIYDGDVIALYPIKFERTKMSEGVYHLDVSKPLPSPDVIYARGIVGYDVDFCQYKIIYTWVCDAWKDGGAVSTALVKNHYEYEVVGNVFMNPEMLMG